MLMHPLFAQNFTIAKPTPHAIHNPRQPPQNRDHPFGSPQTQCQQAGHGQHKAKHQQRCDDFVDLQRIVEKKLDERNQED